MLMSTMSAPMPSTIRAASAIFAGSPPKIWIETGRSSSVYSAYSSVLSMPRTRPSELTISVTTSPHPPCRLTRRRNAVSVMPAIGATPTGACERNLTDSGTAGGLRLRRVRCRDTARRGDGGGQDHGFEPAFGGAAACVLAASSAMALAASTTPVSKAAFSDGLFHSMIAWARKRSRYFNTSPARRWLKTLSAIWSRASSNVACFFDTRTSSLMQAIAVAGIERLGHLPDLQRRPAPSGCRD